jgi:hypothetical protein
MNELDKVITARESAELIGGSLEPALRKIQRACNEGRVIARQDPTGTWLILKDSLLNMLNRS